MFDEAGSEKAAELVRTAEEKGVKLVFPVDYITGDKFDKEAQVHFRTSINGLLLAENLQVGKASDSEGIPDGWLGLDVGEKSRGLFRTTVLEAKTILWNGYVSSLQPAHPPLRNPALLACSSFQPLPEDPRHSSMTLSRQLRTAL